MCRGYAAHAVFNYEISMVESLKLVDGVESPGSHIDGLQRICKPSGTRHTSVIVLRRLSSHIDSFCHHQEQRMAIEALTSGPLGG
jgi:hypothetical protein